MHSGSGYSDTDSGLLLPSVLSFHPRIHGGVVRERYDAVPFFWRTPESLSHLLLFASLGDPTELEEERRLAYVGITRARERLYPAAQ